MKKLNKGVVISYLYFFCNTVISIFIVSFLIKKLGNTNYGVYQTISAFVTNLILLEFGMGSLMTRNILLLYNRDPNDEEVKKNISTVFTLTVILSVIIVAVSALFYCLVGTIYSQSLSSEQIDLAKKIFAFLIVQLILSFFTQTFSGLIMAYEYYSFAKLWALVKLLLRALLVFVIIAIKQDVMILVYIDVFLEVVGLAVTLIFVLSKIKITFSFKYFSKKLFVFSLPYLFGMLLQTIVNNVNSNVDKFLIGIMLSPEAVTIYSIAILVYNMFSSVSSLPLGLFMPIISETLKQTDDSNVITQSLVEPCRFNTIVSGLIFFGFIAVGQQFIKLVYSSEFIESWYYAIIMMSPSFFIMSNSVIINVVDLRDKRMARSLILLSATVVNFVLTIFMLKSFGMLGASIATAVSFVLQLILLNVFYVKALNLKIVYLFKKSFDGILLYLLFASIAATLIGFLIKNVILSFFVAGSIFVILFGALFFLFGANDVEKNFIKVHLKLGGRKK